MTQYSVYIHLCTNQNNCKTRAHAGRSLYGAYKAIQVPEIMVDEVKDFVQLQAGSEYELPLFASKVAAGFPSPADDFMNAKLDLNSHLLKPERYFFCSCVR